MSAVSAPNGTAARRVLIIGAGLTGSMLSNMLHRHPLVTSGKLEVEVWDKARGPGGRASTTRVGAHGGRADLGLQYLSTYPSPATGAINGVYDELLEAQVIAPMTARLTGMNPKYMDPTQQHFVAIEGVSSLAKYFLKNAAHTAFNQTVQSVSLGSGAEEGGGTAGRWVVTTAEGGEQAARAFDGVVVTTPVPQLLGLQGDIGGKIDEAGIRPKLEAVTYSSRWALAIEFGADAWPAFEGVDWDARYVGRDDDDAICYMSVDQRKRGVGQSLGQTAGNGPMLVIHTGVPWSLEHSASLPKEDEPADLRSAVEEAIHTRAEKLLPQVFGQHKPMSTKLHKWRYSQVHKHMEGAPTALELSAAPLLILAGDAYIGSKFDNCYTSANAAMEMLTSRL